MTEEEADIFSKFMEDLGNNQEDIPDDIQDLINENFWDLLDASTND